MKVTVFKRGKRPPEDFDAKKLRASLYAACLSAKSPEGLARNLADQAAREVEAWTAKNQISPPPIFARKLDDF